MVVLSLLFTSLASYSTRTAPDMMPPIITGAAILLIAAAISVGAMICFFSGGPSALAR
jgi:hypothetical protein